MKTLMVGLALLLQQGFDESMKKLADDLAAAPNGASKVGVGDEFVKLTKKHPKKRAELIDAALDCYAKAWPDLDPLWKTKLRENVRRICAGPQGNRVMPVGDWKPDQAVLSGELVHAGASSAKITMYKDGATRLQLTAAVLLPADSKMLEVTAWVLSDGTNAAIDGLQVQVDDGTGKILAAPGAMIDPDFPVWRKLAHSIEVPKGGKRATLIFVFSSSKGIVYVDDVSAKCDGRELLKNGGFEGK